MKMYVDSSGINAHDWHILVF